MRRPPRFGAFGLIAGFALLAAMLPLGAVVPGLYDAARIQSELRAADALRATGQQVAVRLGRGLTEQWREHEALARFAAVDGVSGTFALRLDTAKALNARLAWMGVAAPDGRVVAASDRVLEGQDVSARPWFRAGLQGAFAGDVHDAVLLARHLPAAPGGEPLRLIDFSGPLRRADGSVLGVLGSHVEWAWARELVRTAPSPAQAEAMLVTRDGVVLVGPPALEGRRLQLRVALSAQQGVAATAIEGWEDGAQYLTAAIPVAAAGSLPGFGWSVIVRQDPAALVDTARNLVRAVAAPLLVAAALVFALGLVLARALAQPMQQLATAAISLAEGRLNHPVPDARGTRELAGFASALARLDRDPLQTVPSAAPTRQEAA
jgi:HAMP domain-containing protein